MNKKSTSCVNSTLLLCAVLVLIFSCKGHNDVNKPVEEISPVSDTLRKPNMVNIVNFIRLSEPRDADITEDVLYQTVVNQVNLMKKYNLGGSFLLQYDALMDSRYQQLLKALPGDTFEIGAWWEIPQPLVEKAGLKWRGRYPWDWHADVGFSTGYTPEEREKLADIYMEDFKSVFGYYPKSVASWFIDAHTLNYLYQKYHILASANCKDQYGTDGYTMWGGYWNQAYYPSKVNSYMPAQHKENQIPVPVFRMLGSDPLRQYDTGLGHERQGVISLEPVYPESGGSKKWIDWYFRNFIDGEPLAYAYTQAGQENSFTWNPMKKGLELQFALIARLREQKKVQVKTLAESGAWFREQFETTPATSVTVTDDYSTDSLKTVWFNSRFFRTNFLWENNNLRVRDIHIFDETLESPYLKVPLTSSQANFFTLPVVDGYLWSTSQERAGIRMYSLDNGKKELLRGGTPSVSSPEKGVLEIVWPLTSIEGTFRIRLDEKTIKMQLDSDTETQWFADFSAAKKDQVPFTRIIPEKIFCEFSGKEYIVSAKEGSFSAQGDHTSSFSILPGSNGILISFAGNDR